MSESEDIETPGRKGAADREAGGEPVVVDVSVRWQGDLLALRRLGEGDRAALGEGPDAIVALDLEGLPEGGARPLAWVEAGRAIAWIPEGARGRIAERAGVTRLAFAGQRYVLEPGTRLSLRLGEVELSIEAERAPSPRRSPRWLGWSPFAKVLVGAGYVALLAAFLPSLWSDPPPARTSPAIEGALEIHAVLAAALTRASSPPALR